MEGGGAPPRYCEVVATCVTSLLGMCDVITTRSANHRTDAFVLTMYSYILNLEGDQYITEIYITCKT